MQISVIIATHNRPLLLRESIASIVAQSHDDWEIVITDDGSQPPVDLNDLTDSILSRIKLFRHETPLGPSAARNTGMQAATGDVITFLDDDDLFRKEGLENINAVFQKHHLLDTLFFNIEPFGSGAGGTFKNQSRALSLIIEKMGLSLPKEDSLLMLDSNALFAAMLDHLPMAFQRVAIRINALSKVKLYSGTGFEDLGWFYRVALRCKCAFLSTPCYLVRCEGLNYFSHIDAKEQLMTAIIRIRKELLNLEEVSNNPELIRKVKASLSNAHFNKAYFAIESGNRFPWNDFFSSLINGVSWRHISLAGKASLKEIRSTLRRLVN